MNASGAPREVRRPAATRALVVLLVLQGVSAVGGGATMLIDTSGGAIGMPAELLVRTPFTTFLWPGLLLAVGLGLPALVLAVGVVRRPAVRVFAGVERSTGQHWAWVGSIALGVALMVWIVVQVLLVGPFWLQPVMLVVGAALAGLPRVAAVRRDLTPRTPRSERADGP